MIKHMIPSLIILYTMIAQAYAEDPSQLFLEENIPFDIRISEEPGAHCSPLDLVVEIRADQEYRWLVMDDENIQHEFEHFDDLYYQCDGPGCFMVRIVDVTEASEIKDTQRWHVCLK